MAIDNLAEFTASLKQFADEDVTQATLDMQRQLALSVYRQVILMSPVDTGRFRGSWTLSVQEPDESVLPFVKSSAKRGRGGRVAYAGQAAEQVGKVLDGLQGRFTIVWINNSLPYAPALAEGWSKQAEAGWVDVAIITAVEGQAT